MICEAKLITDDMNFEGMINMFLIAKVVLVRMEKMAWGFKVYICLLCDKRNESEWSSHFYVFH